MPGMPVWEVSEPYHQRVAVQIDLWATGPVLVGRPGRFPAGLQATRVSRPILPCIFNFGPNWDCSWLSYIEERRARAIQATMIVPGGGERTYTPDNTTLEYFSHTALQRTANRGRCTPFSYSGPPAARKDYYQLVPTNRVDAYAAAFLTAKVGNHFGHTNRFLYRQFTSQNADMLALRFSAEYGWPHQHLNCATAPTRPASPA